MRASQRWHSDLDRLLPRLVQMADTHGHIDALVMQVDHAVHQQGVDRHQRKTVEECPQRWRHRLELA